MRPHVFIDCDDCVYQNEWKTADRITTAIAKVTNEIGVSHDQAYALYKTHGTCLKGLLVEERIAHDDAEDFLRRAHDIDYSDIQPDPPLAAMLQRVCAAAPTSIFTASIHEHARRCLERVGAHDAPWHAYIDTRSCAFETKHSKVSFETAMRIAGATEPSQCLFFDDSVKNIRAARAFGWRTVLVGKVDRDTRGPVMNCEEAEVHIATLHELPHAAAHLFPEWAARIGGLSDVKAGSEPPVRTLPV